jgi:glycine betaine/proline transport system ATP-binding protein
MSPVIQVEHLSKVFGGRADEALRLAGDGVGRAEVARRTGATLAVHDVSFDVARGELFVVMGLSGSGKSTLVRLLNRLIEPTAGEIHIDGRPLRGIDDRALRTVRNRTLGMVFQHFALFPHRSVRDNAAYGLKVRGADKGELRERSQWALETVGLGEHGDKMPSELSGGMKQRVGIARALAAGTDVMLMDEPFSALDPLIRRDMQELLLQLQKDLQKTIVFITHDLNEAMRLGDRILLLKDGRTAQLGTGPQILARPANDYVADFVADVDRSRVLTAGDVAREPRVTARLGEAGDALLRRLGAAEANAAYVLDDRGHILGVVRDDALAAGLRSGRTALARDDVEAAYRTTSADRALIDLVHLVGKDAVPLAVVDEDGRLIGVVPKAAVLEALVARETRDNSEEVAHAAPASR